VSERDALLAAICAEPDEDLPRLAFADWCDENDEPDRAALVRTQVELARTPPWDPTAVRVRWQNVLEREEKRLSAELPRVDGYHVEWGKPPLRRGFGWALLVRTLSEWTSQVEPLFERIPIGKVTFWHGLLDDWRTVAASRCLRHLREIVLYASPIEPLATLRDVPAMSGVSDIRFQRSSGAGMPEVLEDLFASPLGRTVRGLHFHTCYESLGEQFDALNTRGPLERLSFSVMGVTADHLRRLLSGPVSATLSDLHFFNEPLGGAGLAALAAGAPATLRDLALVNVGTRADGLEELARSDRLANLRRLTLSRNPLSPRAVKVLSLSRSLAGLRSLDLSDCRIGDKGVRHIVAGKFWRNLVELDLRQNPISAVGVRHLLDAPIPANLTALVLTGDTLGSDDRAALEKKFGFAAAFVPSEKPGW
jgi:uncharacterized protein (TIGR02996 family)